MPVCLFVQVETPLYCPPELPCLGHIHISVCAVGEDGLIYVRTQNAGKHREHKSVAMFMCTATLDINFKVPPKKTL